MKESKHIYHNGTNDYLTRVVGVGPIGNPQHRPVWLKLPCEDHVASQCVLTDDCTRRTLLVCDADDEPWPCCHVETAIFELYTLSLVFDSYQHQPIIDIIERRIRHLRMQVPFSGHDTEANNVWRNAREYLS